MTKCLVRLYKVCVGKKHKALRVAGNAGPREVVGGEDQRVKWKIHKKVCMPEGGQCERGAFAYFREY
jgi:hypothetical protein